MIVVVDERELVKDGYTSLFGREGVPSTGFDPKEFGDWVNTAADQDIDAVEAFLIGQGERSMTLPRAIRDRSNAPVIAISDTPSLETTLAFFDCGVEVGRDRFWGVEGVGRVPRRGLYGLLVAHVLSSRQARARRFASLMSAC